MKTTRKYPGYLQPSVTVDVTIFTVDNDELKVLVIEREQEPFAHLHALPGGFIKEKEATSQAASRVLKEKAGVVHAYLEQLYTFDSPDRDPRGPVFSITYFALVPYEHISLSPTAPGLQHPHLISVRNLPKLAFDHKEIIRYGVKRLQSKLEYTNAVYALLPEKFTLTQLQKAYEAILARPLDKRNFRKKFFELDLVRATKERTIGGSQRPAILYSFKSHSLRELKKFF